MSSWFSALRTIMASASISARAAALNPLRSLFPALPNTTASELGSGLCKLRPISAILTFGSYTATSHNASSSFQRIFRRCSPEGARASAGLPLTRWVTEIGCPITTFSCNASTARSASSLDSRTAYARPQLRFLRLSRGMLTRLGTQLASTSMSSMSVASSLWCKREKTIERWSSSDVSASITCSPDSSFVALDFSSLRTRKATFSLLKFFHTFGCRFKNSIIFGFVWSLCTTRGSTFPSPGGSEAGTGGGRLSADAAAVTWACAVCERVSSGSEMGASPTAWSFPTAAAWAL
mmetsp:Transcript_123696/g.219219  ORF Transcript_123696/g.219219 Transcript_123696/m.219219 type:complete len:293 (-) Transcript_123696:311-1189(-)